MADERAPPPISTQTTVDKDGNRIDVEEVEPSNESPDRASVTTAIKHVPSRNPEVDGTSEVPSITDSESSASPISANWTNWERELVDDSNKDKAELGRAASKMQRRQTPLDFGLLLEAGTSGKTSSSGSWPLVAGDASQAGSPIKATKRTSTAPILPPVIEEPSSTGAPQDPQGPTAQRPEDQVPDVPSDVVSSRDDHPASRTAGSMSTDAGRSLWLRFLHWLRDMQLRLPDRNNFRRIPARERTLVARQRTAYAHILPARMNGESRYAHWRNRRRQQRDMRRDHALQLRELRAGNHEVTEPAAEEDDQNGGNQRAKNTHTTGEDVAHGNDARKGERGARPVDAGASGSKQTAVGATQEVGSSQRPPSPRNPVLSAAKATCRGVKETFTRVKTSFKWK